MNYDNPLDAMRDADPFTAPVDVKPQSGHDRSALLRQITESDSGTQLSTSGDADRFPERRTAILMANPSRKKRWASALPITGAAAVLGLVIGATVVGPGSTPTASAAVVQAARESADLGSGQVTASLSITSADGEPGVTDTFDYRYAGENYTVDYTSGQERLRIIGMGDTVYTKDSQDSELYIPQARDTENAGVVDTIFDLSVETAGPAGVIGLLEETEDLSQGESAAEETVYAGTLSVDAATTLDHKPLALALIEQKFAAEDVTVGLYQLQAVVVDNLLSSITVTMPITRGNETVEAVVVTDFTDLGTTQDITAPPLDEIRDHGREENSPELTELLAIVDDFNERHADACTDADLTDESLPACMEKAGEDALAQEIRRLQSLIPIEDWGA